MALQTEPRRPLLPWETHWSSNYLLHSSSPTTKQQYQSASASALPRAQTWATTSIMAEANSKKRRISQSSIPAGANEASQSTHNQFARPSLPREGSSFLSSDGRSIHSPFSTSANPTWTWPSNEPSRSSSAALSPFASGLSSPDAKRSRSNLDVPLVASTPASSLCSENDNGNTFEIDMADHLSAQGSNQTAKKASSRPSLTRTPAGLPERCHCCTRSPSQVSQIGFYTDCALCEKRTCQICLRRCNECVNLWRGDVPRVCRDCCVAENLHGDTWCRPCYERLVSLEVDVAAHHDNVVTGMETMNAHGRAIAPLPSRSGAPRSAGPFSLVPPSAASPFAASPSVLRGGDDDEMDMD